MRLEGLKIENRLDEKDGVTPAVVTDPAEE